MLIYAYKNTQAHTYPYTHTSTYSYMYSHTYLYDHTYTRTHTLTLAHTVSCAPYPQALLMTGHPRAPGQEALPETASARPFVLGTDWKGRWPLRHKRWGRSAGA